MFSLRGSCNYLTISCTITPIPPLSACGCVLVFMWSDNGANSFLCLKLCTKTCCSDSITVIPSSESSKTQESEDLWWLKEQERLCSTLGLCSKHVTQNIFLFKHHYYLGTKPTSSDRLTTVWFVFAILVRWNPVWQCECHLRVSLGVSDIFCIQ